MLKVVIVDDEAHARENLSRKITDLTDRVNIVGEAHNVSSAFKIINKTAPDVIFLDIEMPGVDGFDLLDKYDVIPFDVVFVTAYNEYALKAFEYFAVAYITKPIDNEYLSSAIDLLFSKKQLKVDKQVIELVKQQQLSNAYSPKLTIPLVSGYELIDVDSITHLESKEGYTYIKLIDGVQKVSSKRLKYYESRLDEKVFKRVHRSYIVNKNRVKSYIKSKGLIVLEDDNFIQINKNNRKSVMDLLQQK